MLKECSHRASFCAQARGCLSRFVTSLRFRRGVMLTFQIQTESLSGCSEWNVPNSIRFVDFKGALSFCRVARAVDGMTLAYSSCDLC